MIVNTNGLHLDTAEVHKIVLYVREVARLMRFKHANSPIAMITTNFAEYRQWEYLRGKAAPSGLLGQCVVNRYSGSRIWINTAETDGLMIRVAHAETLAHELAHHLDPGDGHGHTWRRCYAVCVTIVWAVLKLHRHARVSDALKDTAAAYTRPQSSFYARAFRDHMNDLATIIADDAYVVMEQVAQRVLTKLPKATQTLGTGKRHHTPASRQRTRIVTAARPVSAGDGMAASQGRRPKAVELTITPDLGLRRLQERWQYEYGKWECVAGYCDIHTHEPLPVGVYAVASAETFPHQGRTLDRILLVRFSRREYGGWHVRRADNNRHIGWVSEHHANGYHKPRTGWNAHVSKLAFLGDHTDHSGDLSDNVPPDLCDGNHDGTKAMPITENAKTRLDAVERLVTRLFRYHAPAVGFGRHPHVRIRATRSGQHYDLGDGANARCVCGGHPGGECHRKIELATTEAARHTA